MVMKISNRLVVIWLLRVLYFGLAGVSFLLQILDCRFTRLGQYFFWEEIVICIVG